jgi:dipeptidyl aminopeptidase/acylaminoacyl peptidase
MHQPYLSSRTVLSLAGTLVVVLATGVHHPLAQAPAGVTIADYERALGLQARWEGLVVDAIESPAWASPTRVWYRKSVRGGHTFVAADAETATKRPAFDHARLAAALGAATGKSYTAATLPFSTVTFVDGDRGIRVTAENATWTCTLADYACTKAAAAAGGGQTGGGRGGGGGGGNAGPAGASPDGRSVAFIRDGNIHVRPADSPEDPGVAVTKSGSAEWPFTTAGIAWSPDSKKIAAARISSRGDRRMVRYVESSPADQLQPRTFERQYTKPGDALDEQQRVLVDVPARREIVVNSSLFATPYALTANQWRRDSRAFTFEYNQRGHQVLRVIEVDGSTGAARALIDETSDTFIDYRRADGSLANGGRTYRLDMTDGAEILWMSSRDGWAHLYLYDGVSGRVKNQVTKGNWVVRGVVRVDEAARQVYFIAGGVNPKQDPYFAQYYRINFDGTGLAALTDADGYHTVSFSPDNRFYVDTWSRVDLAPAAQLRRTSDGQVVMELERGDQSALTKAGWRAPASFTAKGRDGSTDIYGVIIRPTNFDPARRYPVIENIYAGPHGSFVPKTFSAYYTMQALAELGFIVVQIDGMGTSNRSKAFHDVAWKNLKDAGFPDRILWHQAVAKRYPYYDISRVGIYGGSAGGQNSLGALLFHGDFYDAAVSFAGCHDNRMDKIWWNEQWMGWPIGPQYEESSNTVHAGRLQGKLLLVVPELDTNVDPSSTMQVVNALIKANKYFDMLVMPGEEHGGGRRGPSAPYGDKKLWDFFVRHLHGSPTPDWNAIKPAPARVGSNDTLFGPTWDEVMAGWCPACALDDPLSDRGEGSGTVR